MKQYILLLAFLINTISLISQENYFPPKGSWEVKAPSVFGINNEIINDAIKYAENNSLILELTTGGKEFSQIPQKGKRFNIQKDTLKIILTK